MMLANFGSKTYTQYNIGLPVGSWVVRTDGEDARYAYAGAGATSLRLSPSPRDGIPATVSVIRGPYDVIVLTH